MRQISPRAWALIALSAVLQVAIFPIAGPLPAWRAALAWFALLPFLLTLLQRDQAGSFPGLRAAASLGYLCGILFYLGNCYWIFQTMHLYGGLPKPVAFVILILFALYLGLYHALFAMVISLLRPLGIRGTLLLTPFAWVTVELARARITFFPWDLLGYSQVDNSVMTRIAPLAGVMAISFVVASINAGLAAFFLDRRRLRTGVAFLILALALPLAGRIPFPPEQPNPYRPVAVMMQENLEVGAVGKEVQPLSLPQEMSEFSSRSLSPTHYLPGDKGEADWAGVDSHRPAIILWPEAPSHLISSDPFFRASIGQLARAANAPAIIGSLGLDRSTIPARGYYVYDSASIFSAGGDYVGRYDKIHLVPWGEYVPFKEFFAFADKLTEGVGDMDRGNTRSVFHLGGHEYGVFVCYESIFGDEVRQFANNGAEVLVNISDDGWYGDSGAPWQHLNMARMRAIENHRWLLRDTNTGVTAAIDPEGRMAAQAPRHVRGAYAFPFGFERGTTFYTRHGDWFAWLCAVVTLFALLIGRLKPKHSLGGQSRAPSRLPLQNPAPSEECPGA
jgi:apolipoprotein N-acyltransferase